MEKIKILNASYYYELENEWECFLESEREGGKVLEIIETQLLQTSTHAFLLKVRYKKINILDML